MSRYKHGIATKRKKTKMPQPSTGKSIVQVVVGTAPINTLDNPSEAVNKVILLNDEEDVSNLIGDTTEIERYTIMHSVYASFHKHMTAPIVAINVLDPENPNHVEVVVGEEYTVVKKVVTIEDLGILRDKVVVSEGETVYTAGDDYVTSFSDEGFLKIGITGEGALKDKEKITVAYSKLNPDGVSASDIIGGIDENMVKTGVELIDDVFPETKLIPTVALAPIFSKYASVALALESKVQKIYGMFNGIAFVDVATSGESGAKDYTKVKAAKEKNLPASRWAVPFWPLVKVDGMKLSYSAFAAALLQSLTTENKDIPSESIDNQELLIDGICTDDGTPVTMTQDDVNDYLNAYGIVGAVKLPEWKAWGNNTAAYPASEDPIDRWIKSVAMLNYLENKFKSDYLPRVGRNANYKLIEGIVSEFNMAMNSLVPDYLAGGEIVFRRKDNPLENIMKGRIKFSTRYADYTPAEYIENEFEYDVNFLQNALGGGENE